VATIILFRCAHLAFEDIAAVLKTNDLEGALRAIAKSEGAIVLIGPDVPAGASYVVVDAVVKQRGYFLRTNERDSLAWLRRMVRFALRPGD